MIKLVRPLAAGVMQEINGYSEKAYRKASKNLSDTSSAHSGLLNLKESLSSDISKAQMCVPNPMCSSR
jgi:hypothetical protein